MQRLKNYIRNRVPDALLPYLFTVLALAIVTLPFYVLGHFQVPRNIVIRSVSSVAYIAIILGAARLNYGPGLLACALISFAIMPQLAPAARAVQANLTQFAVLAAISLLVSRTSRVSRCHEAGLRRAAAELEERVRQRTAEAVESANAVREQAELLELAYDAILALDADCAIRYWSPGAERMYGWSKAEAIGRVSHELLKTPRSSWDDIEQCLASGRYWDGELVHTCRDGTPVRVLSRWALRHDAEGRKVGYLEINSDITERRKIEEQLRHSQKLESLGVLAGGVAHDFNNLLTGILGNASLVLDATQPQHPNYPLLEEVVRAAERASDLTCQLLAYAGKGRFVLRVVGLSDLVREISGLVQTSIPKGVELRLELADSLPGIEADPGQLQQIIMNLVINGAEAIGPAGGTVVVRTGSQQVDNAYIAALGGAGEHIRPGAYVSLEVHDTGSGMSPETLVKIFDPFFTTKFTGRGLGLSAVQGIVRAHRGALEVYSTPGRGTSFRVLFPASLGAASATLNAFSGDLAGHGAILVVDDEEAVRSVAVHTLERYGYQTLTAANGAEALEVFRRDPDRIALVLLDLTMPVMSGDVALRKLLAIRPSVKVLLTSGYNEIEAVEHLPAGLAGFIQKPYTAVALAGKVKQIVSQAASTGG